MCEMSTQAAHLCIMNKLYTHQKKIYAVVNYNRFGQIHQGSHDASNQHQVRDTT